MSEESIGRAIEATDDLRRAIDSLAQRADINRDGIARGKRNTKWLAVSVALDIVLSVILALGGNALHNVQNDQRESTELNRVNQCAMMDMFLSYETATNRATNLSPEEKQQRADGYAVLHRIHEALKCTNK